MVDIHTHILPHIDDGAESSKDTLAMLKELERSGIKKVVATPHYIWGRYENKYEDICSIGENIKIEAAKNAIDIEIIFGQEVFLDKHTIKLYKQEIIKGINGTNYILLELPMKYLDFMVLDIIYELRLLGLKPIIAHPERYNFLIEDILKINDFIDEGCLFQIDAGSIEGIFGKSVKKTAEKLIKQGVCNFIASDVHSKRRMADINHALSVVGKIDKNLENYIRGNGNCILNDEDINQKVYKIFRKKTIFDFIMEDHLK